jgi:SAM-dependent methyltransferase
MLPVKILFILLCTIAGLAILWIFPLKLVTRLARSRGLSSPCPSSLAWVVNNPIRRRYMRPLLERVGVQPGERVLELGPGPGTFTVEAAKLVGPNGRIEAVDIQPGMIGKVRTRVREMGLSNVVTHVAGAYDLPLADASVDRAFLVTVLPEIPDHARALAELRRVLKPGGVLSITDDLDPDYPSRSQTIRRVEASRFRLEKRFGNWWVYTLNFKTLQDPPMPAGVQPGGIPGPSGRFPPARGDSPR